jgi:hypothetical protein
LSQGQGLLPDDLVGYHCLEEKRVVSAEDGELLAESCGFPFVEANNDQLLNVGNVSFERVRETRVYESQSWAMAM